MATLDNVKTLLELDSTNTSKDNLINLYISRATNFIKDYTKMDSIPESLQDVIEEMAVFQFRQKGVENIDSEGKGSLSESYVIEYPPNIMNRIKPYKRALFI